MGKRILLVEGNDDKHVLLAIFATHQVPQRFEIDMAKSVETLLDSISVRVKESDLESIAFVLDADESIEKRWNQVRDRLTASGCAGLPSAPAPEGTVAHITDGPKVGVWIMPDNQVPGILENFLAFLVPEKDALLPRVDRFLDEIPEELRAFPLPRKPKARIHAWLAVQAEPGKPLGQAVTAKYFDARHPQLAPFLAWVTRSLVEP